MKTIITLLFLLSIPSSIQAQKDVEVLVDYMTGSFSSEEQTKDTLRDKQLIEIVQVICRTLATLLPKL